jgi:tripartite ATP-independent transporter DctM subunit
MNPFALGIIGVFALLAMFATGIPIAIAMLLVGVVGFAIIVSSGSAMYLMAQDIWGLFHHYPITVIPMFVLMGSFAFSAGIGRRLFEMTRVVLGETRGGLTVASVAAATGFGAVCGSSTATSATIGKMALPEMKRYGYSDQLSTGVVAVSGGLGILIPPSVAFVVYGILTELSIGKLFIAGILPGIMLAGLFMTTIWILCLFDPTLAPPGPRTTWKQKGRSLIGLLDAAVLFALTMGGLFAGYFGPSQAGAIGSVGAIAIGIVRRELTWEKFLSATKDGLQISCMIMLLMATAMVFGHFMAVSTIPTRLLEYAETLALPPWGILLLIASGWFVLGCFIDSMPLLLLVLPIVYPVVIKLGYDGIWFGVFKVVLGIMALVTPPVGVNAYVTQAVAKDVPLEVVFKGILPLLIPLTVALILLLIFPQIALFLPGLIKY